MDEHARAVGREASQATGRADLEESALLAVWLTAWLQGAVSLDDARDAVVGPDAAHDVVGADGAATPFILALGGLRAAGAVSASLALPVPGDPLGLAGPPAFNAEALEAGQAVLIPGSDQGLVPVRAGAGVVWRALPAAPPPPTQGVAAAEHDLRRAVTETTETLVDLEVARWRPEVADELMDLRRPLSLPLPASVPGRSQALLALATRCRRIAALALVDDGSARTAAEAEDRRRALVPLDAAARRAVVAACESPRGR